MIPGDLAGVRPELSPQFGMAPEMESEAPEGWIVTVLLRSEGGLAGSQQVELRQFVQVMVFEWSSLPRRR